MKNFTLIFVAMVFGAFFTHGAEMTKEEKEAVKILSSSKLFYDTAVGEGAEMPREVKAFRTILGGKNADELFKKALKEGTLSGRLYALCGIYYTDPKFFKVEIEKYRESREITGLQIGCSIIPEKVSDLVECLEPGAVRLESPRQTIQEWEEKNRDQTNGRYRLDIIGGGWPNKLKEDGGYKKDGGVGKTKPPEPRPSP